MKKITSSAFVLAVSGLALSATAAFAQIDLAKAEPAEFPPSSYTAKQYVDSRGCVFVRAGIDGATRWVPRVARNRQVICGFKPTLTAEQTRAAQSNTTLSEEVVQIVPKQSAETTPEPQVVATPAPTVQATPAPAPAAPRPTARAPRTNSAPIETIASAPARTATRPAPVQTTRRAPVVQKPVVRQQVVQRPVAAAKPTVKKVAPAKVAKSTAGNCAGASALSAKYISKGANVRCGPQDEPHVFIKGQKQTVRSADGTTRTVRTRGAKVYAGTSGVTQITGQTTIAPKKVYEARKGEVQTVPKGYKRAFDDGRLNPKRAHQTLDGRRRMLLTWTNTTPRQLVDKLTGEEVSRFFPDLQYPYTSPRQQQEALKKQAKKQARVATKSAPQPSRPASHRFVQAGTYPAAQAQAAIQKLQRAGLPVKISEYTKDGQAFRIVLAGPYSQQKALDTGFQTVRGLGFSGAKLRK